MERKLFDFWTQTLSCTLGTVIGIVLTFGTSAWIEYRERQEMERQPNHQEAPEARPHQAQ